MENFHKYLKIKVLGNEENDGILSDGELVITDWIASSLALIEDLRSLGFDASHVHSQLQQLASRFHLGVTHKDYQEVNCDHSPDAECTQCGEKFFSAEGHPDQPICMSCCNRNYEETK